MQHGDNRQAADEFGLEAVFYEVFGTDVGE